MTDTHDQHRSASWGRKPSLPRRPPPLRDRPEDLKSKAAGEVPTTRLPPIHPDDACRHERPGLIILPTPAHRRLEVDAEQLRRSSANTRIVERFGTDAKAAWEHLQIDGGQSALGFGTVADGKWFVARLRDTAAMMELAPEHSPEWQGLGVSILHQLVINKLLREKLGGTPVCHYVHSLQEVAENIAEKRCQIAALVPPVMMGHVERIAGNLETMPAKSTYFYPKLLTGMVFNSLKKD